MLPANPPGIIILGAEYGESYLPVRLILTNRGQKLTDKIFLALSSGWKVWRCITMRLLRSVKLLIFFMHCVPDFVQLSRVVLYLPELLSDGCLNSLLGSL